MILDLFAGPGGWDLAARGLGLHVLGLEVDDDVCKTRAAAGLPTRKGDVARMSPGEFGPIVDGLIGSPPCPTFSAGGDGAGRQLTATIYRCLYDLERGEDTRAWARGKAFDILEPIKWREECEAAEKAGREPDPRKAAALARRDADMSLLVVEPLRWALALEPTWIALEEVPPVLELWEEYKRILTAKGWRAWCGVLSAERYGVPQTRRRAILLAHRDRYPMPPQATHQEYVPGEPARHELTFEGELLPWVSMADALGWGEGQVGFPRLADGLAATEDGYRERDFRSTDEPAFNLTEKARSWMRTRPATTVQGDSRIWPPGHKKNAEDAAAGRDYYEGRAGENAYRVTVEEAATLQGFPSDYPFRGSRSKQFQQVGNAVPPPVAGAILAELAADEIARREAA